MRAMIHDRRLFFNLPENITFEERNKQNCAFKSLLSTQLHISIASLIQGAGIYHLYSSRLDQRVA